MAQLTEQPRLYTEAETASYLGVSRKTLQGWRYYRKELPFVKVGSAVRYTREAIEAWIKNNTVEVVAA